jgi:hypothetical protein
MTGTISSGPFDTNWGTFRSGRTNNRLPGIVVVGLAEEWDTVGYGSGRGVG